MNSGPAGKGEGIHVFSPFAPRYLSHWTVPKESKDSILIFEMRRNVPVEQENEMPKTFQITILDMTGIRSEEVAEDSADKEWLRNILETNSITVGNIEVLHGQD